MTQKAAAGDWWLHHDNTPTHASCLVLSFLTKRQITQVTQPHYSPDLAPCDFWLFPKLKSPLKGRRFQTIVDEIQENTTGQLMVIGRTVWGPKCLLWRGLRRHCPGWNVSCILLSSSANGSIFRITWLGTFWADLLCFLFGLASFPLPISHYLVLVVFHVLFCVMNMLNHSLPIVPRWLWGKRLCWPDSTCIPFIPIYDPSYWL